ncbi:electron transfer flavoprotein subunit beta/FixA family protein [Paenibacillus sp. PAMC21692]|uniref:electron transfer flavoprotein subunit beta/FixA family protein n=1 Tax=Paenibacillus sp. PAMC21692 TaxID=2762320 RepID=UPI00164D7BA8|nr:electron transfer flavoprotein subunit beta/FixA family protein [Paenibacillus sp. PAMC21692]QNK56957.1 electron transfer flavoprotein subunit beta/FixA family protein [Paenibacillus sp. PAMC21692]
MQTIVVLLKQTFDTEEKITVTPQGIEERDAKLVINPYDEYALEEALRIKERSGGNVVVVTCGPERAQEALRTALAVGADEAVRIDSAGLGSDSHALSAALAAVIEPLSPDLLLAGLFAVDSGSGSVSLQVAERLGLPHASAAVKLSIGSAAELGVDSVGSAALYALVERDVEGDTETVAIPLPALVTAQQGLNEPRYPSLPGIMKAKRKPLKVVEPDEIGLGGDKAAEAIRTRQISLSPPPPRAAGKRIGGAAAQQASELFKLLQDEAKVL